MMSEEERECLQSDLESARLNIAETERALEDATSRNADLEEEIREMRGETEGYTAKVGTPAVDRRGGNLRRWELFHFLFNMSNMEQEILRLASG